MSRTVAEHLAERARTHPAQVALHIPAGPVSRTGPTAHRAVTFAELHADSDTLAAGLRSVGIVAGTRVALMVPPGLDFFSLTFALFKIGAVPVLIDPGMGVKNLKACLGHAEPEAFVGTAKAHLARRLFGWAKRSVRTTVNAGESKFFCTTSTKAMRRDLTHRPPLRSEEGEQERLAAILFTSGSTGIAKGVEYTHAIFSAQIELLKATYGIEPGEIDFCTFPLFALFGAALGMTCVIPDMDATRPATIDPWKAASQIRQFGVTNVFGSPAVLKTVTKDNFATASDYATVRRVISAGAPATPAVLELLARWLPAGTPVYTPYGATECLPVANISSAEILNETRALTEQGHGVCVGKPVAGMHVMVIPITDGAIASLEFNLQVVLRRDESSRPDARDASPSGLADSPRPPGRADGNLKVELQRGTGIAPNVIGEFVVRGPVVTPRYFRNPQATALAKIHDPVTGETLHRMGDVGYIDDQGRLWFCGRKSQRVVTAHGTLFTDMVEPVFNTVEGVVRTALVGLTRNNVTRPVLLVEIERVGGYWIKMDSEFWKELYERLEAKAKEHPHTSMIDCFLEYPGKFPVDVRHNSKIFREKLAKWVDESFYRKGPR